MSTLTGRAVFLSLLIIIGCSCSRTALADERETAFDESQWVPLPRLSGQEALIPLAVAKLQNGLPINRRRAAFILGQIGTPQALQALRSALEDSDRWVRIHAGVGLAQQGVAEGYQGAKAALYEGPAWHKYYAIYGLNQIRDERALRLLEQNPCEGSPFLSRVVKAAQRPELVQSPRGPFYQQPLPAQDWPELLEIAAQALVDECDTWFHGGDYDQAIRCNEAAVFLQPARVEVYASTAWLQWSMNRHGAAISTYRRAIDANPGNWEAYFELGFYYMHHGHPSAAVEYLRQSSELGAPPIRARTYAHALEKVGKLKQALRVWQQLDRIDQSGAVDANLRRLQELVPGTAGGR